jgi:hypothetical protein
MRSVGWIGLALAMTQALPARATEPGALLGIWEQIATNAGACPTCRIGFRESEQGLSVAANNGWAATLGGSRGSDIVGAGRWVGAKRNWAAGRPFTVCFRLDGDRLSMTMTVDTGTEPKRIIRGIFKRAWQGV